MAKSAPALRSAPAAVTGQVMGGVAQSVRPSEPDFLTRAALPVAPACYRLPRLAAGGIVAGLEAAASRDVRSQSEVRARAVAPVRGERGGAAGERIVRLDSTRARSGFLVRSATGDSAIGFWQRSGGDSLSVQLPAAGMFLVAAADRVVCPE